MNAMKNLWNTAERGMIPENIPEYVQKDGITIDQLSKNDIFEIIGDVKTASVSGLVLDTRRINKYHQILFARKGDGTTHILSCHADKLDDTHKVLLVGHVDSAGGVHENGLGWGPDGIFCGECSNTNCATCKALIGRKIEKIAYNKLTASTSDYASLIWKHICKDVLSDVFENGFTSADVALAIGRAITKRLRIEV